MKKISLQTVGLSFISAGLLFIQSCKEVGPAIDFGNAVQLGDTIYVAAAESVKPKNVLIEEFTAVRCNNCPLGHQDTETLENNNPGRVFTVGVHSGLLAIPYTSGAGSNDFRSPESNFIDSYLGGVLTQPSASINRTLFPSETSLILSRQKWSGYVNQELTKTSPANLYLTSQYNASTRIYKVNLKTAFTQDLTDTLAVTIALTEDNIREPQKQPDETIDSNYIHKHVLRKILTPFSGRVLGQYTFPKGTVVVKNFTDTLKSQFIPENCSLVAYLHKVGSDKSVIQVSKTKLK